MTDETPIAGKIYGLQTFPRALSAEEIKRVYEDQKAAMTDETPRCEPPPELRDRDGWHVLDVATGDAQGHDCWYWVPAEQYYAPEGVSGGWTKEPLRENAEIIHDFEDVGVTVFAYLAPVTPPAVVDALVEALEVIRDQRRWEGDDERFGAGHDVARENAAAYAEAALAAYRGQP